MSKEITLDTPIEELVKEHPEAVGFLARHKVRCIRCGEPLWLTVGELLNEEGVENHQFLIDELKRYLNTKKSPDP
ncbi:MAG: DUF1858 domain-containing protein [Candidatus Aminicenantaceae bacterium]